MTAVLTLCLSNLRKKKFHNGMIGLLILLSTLLLATSITVMMNSNNLFTDMHKKTNGSHEMLEMLKGLHDPDQVYQWWNKQDGVSTSKLLPFRKVGGMKKEGEPSSTELSSLTLYMMDTPERPFVVDELLFAQGKESAVPAKGEIWLPTSIAYLYDLAVGDRLEFSTGNKKFTLQVSAVVVDIPFGAPFPTDARIWMNHEDYAQTVQGIEGKEQYMLGLRYEGYSSSSSYWDKFEQEMGTPFLETKISLEQMSSFYLIINKIIGFIMIFMGIVMILVALFTIGFTISDDILSNYKTIGVIKALGLTSKKIASVYLMQYIFISIIGIVPGLAISRLLSDLIIKNTLSSLKGIPVPGGLAESLITLIVGIFVIVMVILCVAYYANKARSIQPMQAIRFGMSETDNSKLLKRFGAKQNSLLAFGRAPLSIVLGLRNVMKNRKASILMLLLATVMSAVLVLGFVLLYSIGNIKKTAADWGYDSSDISLVVVNSSSFPKGEVDQLMRSDTRIKNIGWLGYVNAVVSDGGATDLDVDTVDRKSMNFSVTVLDGSYDEVGYTTIKGRNPKNKNEISIGIRVAKQLNKDVGDTIEIYIEGHKQSLIVSGIYQSISNQSESARIIADTLQVSDPDYGDYAAAFINVNDPLDADTIVSEIGEKYKDSATVATMQTLLDATFKQAFASIILPMSFMGLLFTAVTMVIIYSISRTNIRKESKTYGIYKSVGLTSSRIRWSVTRGIVAVSAIGAVLGMVLGVYFLPVILRSIFLDYGIADLPLIINWGAIISMACFTMAAAGLGTWASSRVVARTSPRILVIE
ncbi:putative ABC transport system permease protein [Paenibacillus cellulosilyticus]|uniref:Putative ABC transport system permease protein n=1 Tax=Paenibacillus cellulosilyticus TaxID=375489 RepID=A0A2V2YXV9_9BACL|nr:FtsX-like permease family protein [Paenibacillus cellulosilyticus]PWW06587.1 putative ABC transport system permease protein [Paenibacillus cellulosilyticus]QKS46084.1 FtsX-like permease family protein [Paenibacillus cellulosilyticus]